MSGSDDLTAMEKRARRELESDLEPVQQLAFMAHRLLGLVAGVARAEPNRPRLAARVCVHLINRASNDLRCAALLADMGYVAQVAALCASMYEALVTAAHVAGDDGLAREWLAHEDPREFPFGGALKLTRSVFGRRGDDAVAAIYDFYHKVCVPKHVNPVYERGAGIDVEKSKDGVYLQNGPDTSDWSRRILWYALTQGSRVVALTMTTVADAFVATPADQERIAPPLEQLFQEAQAMHERYSERWRGDRIEGAEA